MSPYGIAFDQASAIAESAGASSGAHIAGVPEVVHDAALTIVLSAYATGTSKVFLVMNLLSLVLIAFVTLYPSKAREARNAAKQSV